MSKLITDIGQMIETMVNEIDPADEDAAQVLKQIKKAVTTKLTEAETTLRLRPIEGQLSIEDYPQAELINPKEE